MQAGLGSSVLGDMVTPTTLFICSIITLLSTKCVIITSVFNKIQCFIKKFILSFVQNGSEL